MVLSIGNWVRVYFWMGGVVVETIRAVSFGMGWLWCSGCLGV